MDGHLWPALPQDNFGYELPAVEAAMKKHEAIEADIAAYEERVQGVAELAQALATEGYYDARRVAAQRDSVLRQWALLTGLVGARRTRLEQNLALQKAQRWDFPGEVEGQRRASVVIGLGARGV